MQQDAEQQEQVSCRQDILSLKSRLEELYHARDTSTAQSAGSNPAQQRIDHTLRLTGMPEEDEESEEWLNQRVHMALERTAPFN